MLESTRQYALGKLAAGGEYERLARRYANYYCNFARQPERGLSAIPLSEWLARIEPELENLRATMDWTLVKGQEVALGAFLAGALEMFWWHGGLEAEGLRWIDLALHKIDAGQQPGVAAQLRQAFALLMSRVLYS